MSVRKTIKMFLAIVCTIGLVGGGYGYWVWTNANKLLLQNVRETLAEKLPGWDIHVNSARFDWHRRIHVYDVTLKAPNGQTTLARIPEIILTVDKEKLSEKQIVDVQRIRFLRPELHLTRDGDGTWNWQKLPPPRKSEEKSSLPEIVVEEATVHLRLLQSDGSKPADFGLTQAGLKLVPAASRQFLIEGSTVVKDAGKLGISGKWNLDRTSWALDGTMQDIQANGELLALAVGTSPELRASVAKLEAALRKVTPPDERPHTPVNADAVPNLGASAILDVNFHLAKPSPDGELQFRIRSQFQQGRIENPALPCTLNEVSGEVFWTNDRVEFKDVSARNGEMRIQAAGRIERAGKTTPVEISVNATNLPVNTALRKRVPAAWKRLYDTIHPAGQIDVRGRLSFDGVRTWKPIGFVLTARNCSFAHEAFPYPFRDVSGTVRQKGNLLMVEMHGKAGRQPAWLTGSILHPGPRAISNFNLNIQELPIDETFIAACKPGLQKVIRSLDFTGKADVQFSASIRAGTGLKPHTYLIADFKDSSIEYEKFPYRLNRLSGRVTFDSSHDLWTFTNLTAYNGPAKFTGTARLTKENGHPRFVLNVDGKGAYLDKPLYRALPAPIQKLWREFSPTGLIDITVSLDWTSGQPVVISIPSCTVTQGTMTVRAFPYPFENITARFAYAADVLRILSFSATHESTRIAATGFAETLPREWRLRLVKFRAYDLIPDRHFRQALSPNLRSVVDQIDPQGTVDISGMLEFRGTKREGDPVTSAWDLKVHLNENSLNLGPKLENVTGEAVVRGTWDGKIVDMRSGNRLDFKSATVHGYTFTDINGPYQFYDRQLIVGSAELFRPRRRDEPTPRIDPKNRMTAKAIGGDFTIDALARFEGEPVYRILITMNNARLERFAKEYLNGKNNLKGVMYGRVQLSGKGTSTKNLLGSGKLLISPAALYELPVLVQTFKVMTFVPVDKTAFRFAYTEFDVAKQQFLFRRIDLVGDTISLRGRGAASFDGRVALDFYSMLPRSRLPGVILKQLVSSATAGWVGVEVRGTAKNPVARIRAVPQVEDTLKAFLTGLGRGPVPIPFVTPPPRANRTMPYRR